MTDAKQVRLDIEPDAQQIWQAIDPEQKRFATLAAQFALTGHALVRSPLTDGPAAFYVMRWGCIKPLASLDACERFLNLIKGDRNVAD